MRLPALRTLFGFVTFAVCASSAQALDPNHPYLETFDDGSAQQWRLAEGWQVQGTPETGMYLSSKPATGPSYATYQGETFSTGFSLTARMLVPEWRKEERVGIVFGREDQDNFYEASVDARGTVTLERVRKGTRERLESNAVRSPLQDRRWTDVQVEHVNQKVTVRLNGVPALQDVTVERAAKATQVGLVSQGATSRFDYVVVTTATGDQGPNFPRLATVRIGAGPKGAARRYSDTEAQSELAKMHVALLHYDTSWPRRHGSMNDVVKSLKQRNPNIKVVLYTKANEVNFTNGSPDKSEPELHAKAHKDDWWVRDAQGNPVRSQYKDEFKLVNLTRFGPKVDGLSWPQWYARWSYERYYEPNPLVDGLYMDNVSWQPHPTATHTADWDRDGKPDLGTREDVRSWFRQGYRDYFDETARLLPAGKLRFANAARWGQTTPADNASLAEYYGMAHGGVIESLIVKGKKHAPEDWGGWQVMLNYYRKVMSVLAPPKIGIVMHGLTSATDYQDMRYGLGSTLMDNGYYAAHVQSEGYTSTRWYDEFGIDMGQAAGPPPMRMWKDGVWRRDFQRAIVLVNPKGNGARTVNLEQPFQKIKGAQDPAVNDGKKVSEVTLQDRDAIILLK